jgi:hypothetical protein
MPPTLWGGELNAADYSGLDARWITRELADAAGLRRVDSITIVGRNGSGDYEGLVFPYIWPGETQPREYRLRTDRPEIAT